MGKNNCRWTLTRKFWKNGALPIPRDLHKSHFSKSLWLGKTSAEPVLPVVTRITRLSKSMASQQRFATSPNRNPVLTANRIAPCQSPCAQSPSSRPISSSENGSLPDLIPLSRRLFTAATGFVGIKPILRAASKGTLSTFLTTMLHVVAERPSCQSLSRKPTRSFCDTDSSEAFARVGPRCSKSPGSPVDSAASFLGDPAGLVRQPFVKPILDTVEIHRLAELIFTISAITLRPWAAVNSFRRAISAACSH